MAAKKKAAQKPAGKKVARKRGRPSKYTPAIAAEICRRLSEGEPYVRICALPDMPDLSTIWRWEEMHEDFRKLSARALELGTNAIAHDCLRIADDQDIDAAHKRIMVDTRLRLIGKWNAKRYGDRLNVKQETSVEEAETEDLVSELKRQCEAQGIDLSALLK